MTNVTRYVIGAFVTALFVHFVPSAWLLIALASPFVAFGAAWYEQHRRNRPRF